MSLLVLATLVAQAPGLTVLPPPDPDAEGAASYSSDVSADGGTVVGQHSNVSGVFALRAIDGAVEDLGDLPGGIVFTSADFVSNDGSVVAGTGWMANVVEPGDVDGVQIAFRFTGDGYSPWPDLTGNEAVATAGGISADGAVLVGASYTSPSGDFMPYWTDGEVAVLLPVRDGATRGSAVALSDDGTVVLITDDAVVSGLSQGSFLVVDGAGQVLQGPTFLGGLSPNAISADGRIAVGGGLTPSGDGETVFAARVSLDDPNTVVSLGDLDGGLNSSEAIAVNDDGSVIVGRSSTGIDGSPDTEEAFVWTSAGGMRRLEDVAVAAGVDVSALGGGYLGQARSVSADGTVIVGNAVVVDAATGSAVVRAFVLTLPADALVPGEGEGEGEDGFGVGDRLDVPSDGCGCSSLRQTHSSSAAPLAGLVLVGLGRLARGIRLRRASDEA
jgi:uncharacterized membrane protein